jgi:hypothetical protein
MIDELWIETIWNEAVVAKSISCPGIYLAGLRKTKENRITHAPAQIRTEYLKRVTATPTHYFFYC